jgi:arginyl-tRNA synthetase
MTGQLLDKVEVAGPGFINFYLSPSFFVSELQSIISLGKNYGTNESFRGKRVIVEYSSPNIAKPFTVGHLRSTIIGDAIAGILEVNGWEVMRDNHLGDWGTQFGKQIVALHELGEGTLEKNMAKINASDNPVKELVALYVEFHEKAEKDQSLEDKAREWFKKLEDGDVQARQLWQQCVDWSWVEFAKIYARLNVTFSEEFSGGRGLGEAFFEDKMDVVLQEMQKQAWYQVGKDGAKLVFFPDEKYPPAMIVKKDGATLYATRDLATDYYRRQTLKPDLIVNEVGMEQSLYFKQLYEIEKMLGWYTDGQRVHVGHGLYRFSEGKMSTRKGNVIWLEEVLEEAVKRAGELGKGDLEVSEQVAIGALKWNDLKGETSRDIVFDWDTILSMKGNSGPYMQYTVVRARSVLAKAKTENWQLAIGNYQFNLEEMAVLRWLYQYPEVVAQAGKQYSPHLLATYLYELAQRFNGFYNKHNVLSTQDDQQRRLRLALTSATATVLTNGLAILGIQVPEKM